MKPKKKFKWSFLFCREDNVRNNTIDDCKAAVDSAGLEYGLDEEKLFDYLRKQEVHLSNWDVDPRDKETLEDSFGTLQIKRIANALKLAERELIVRKKK